MVSSIVFEQGILIDAAALAAVALVAYLYGRRPRVVSTTPADDPLRCELSRGQRAGDELRRLTTNVDTELTAHQRSVAAFQSQLSAMETGAVKADWSDLRTSADALLGPTLKFATNLTLAGEQLRRQHAQLSALSGSRIDRATGLNNRRSLEEQLDAFFSIHSAGKRRFALALFSVSSTASNSFRSGDEQLRQVARLLEECIREDDFVARYSDDEFVVLMPQTRLVGALAFSERLLVRGDSLLGCALWGGVVEAMSDESADKLLSRADSALYSARAAGEPSLYLHTGLAVRRHPVELGKEAAGASLADPAEGELAGALP